MKISTNAAVLRLQCWAAAGDAASPHILGRAKRCGRGFMTYDDRRGGWFCKRTAAPRHSISSHLQMLGIHRGFSKVINPTRWTIRLKLMMITASATRSSPGCEGTHGVCPQCSERYHTRPGSMVAPLSQQQLFFTRLLRYQWTLFGC